MAKRISGGRSMKDNIVAMWMSAAGKRERDTEILMLEETRAKLTS